MQVSIRGHLDYMSALFVACPPQLFKEGSPEGFLKMCAEREATVVFLVDEFRTSWLSANSDNSTMLSGFDGVRARRPLIASAAFRG